MFENTFTTRLGKLLSSLVKKNIEWRIDKFLYLANVVSFSVVVVLLSPFICVHSGFGVVISLSRESKCICFCVDHNSKE